MDIISLYQDYSVNFLTEGNKHCREGWVNTPCPHCTGNEGYHLGYNLDGDYYVCWRCGSHPIPYTISKLIHVPYKEVHDIIKQYGLFISKTKEPVIKIRIKAHKLPSNTIPLAKNHRQYLEGRKFDVDKLEKTFNLLGTGPISKLDGIDYKHRIIMPFIWKGQQVSFDSRDITGKDPARYRACPLDRELIPHKEILYGKEEFWKETGICVEGITDVFRFGVNSFATSGIKYTPYQIVAIKKIFKRVAVCFDDDPQAIVQAKKLVSELRVRGVDAFRIDIVGDPGAMDQSEADYLVKQLMR